MQCNIDAKGKAVRLVGGTVTLAIGLVLIGLGVFAIQPATVWLVAGIFTSLAGAFQIYEGWSGWCVVRAMGFKTRL